VLTGIVRIDTHLGRKIVRWSAKAGHHHQAAPQGIISRLDIIMQHASAMSCAEVERRMVGRGRLSHLASPS
jgi:hypothetical protein